MMMRGATLDRDTIAQVAAAVRHQLAPRASVLTAAPLEVLAQRDVRVTGIEDTFTTRARCGIGLPPNVWGLTTFARARAWIWLSREAWAEVTPTRMREGTVPRTRFTLAHELGHVALHADELVELDVTADPDHDARLEAEANAFAAELLVPAQALRRLTRARADDIALRFGVSVPMAQRRLDEARGGGAP